MNDRSFPKSSHHPIYLKICFVCKEPAKLGNLFRLDLENLNICSCVLKDDFEYQKYNIFCLRV